MAFMSILFLDLLMILMGIALVIAVAAIITGIVIGIVLAVKYRKRPKPDNKCCGDETGNS